MSLPSFGLVGLMPAQLQIMLTGTTPGYRIFRAVVVVLIPVFVGLGVYNYITPPIGEESAELRVIHPTSPQAITVYPPEYFMKK